MFGLLIAFGAVAAVAAGPTSAASASQILISNDRPTGNQLYLANSDGTDLHKVGDRSQGQRLEGITPDGSRIVFAVFSAAAGGSVTHYSMDLLGGDVKPFATTPTTAQIAFSPTGDGIAYEGDGEIYRADADGGNAQALTTNPCAGADYPDCPYPHWGSPRFSPNGRYLATSFEPHSYDARDVAILDLAEAGDTPLSTPKLDQHACCLFSDFVGFAPDSSAFIEIGSSPGGPTPKVLLRPTAGGATVQLTPDGQYATAAYFLRDGRVVEFDHPDDSPNGSGTHAYVEQPDGSQRHRVRRRTLPVRVFTPGSDSPDGTKVLTFKGQNSTVENSTVYVSNPDGSGRVQIMHSRGESSAIWVPEPAASQSAP